MKAKEVKETLVRERERDGSKADWMERVNG